MAALVEIVVLQVVLHTVCENWMAAVCKHSMFVISCLLGGVMSGLATTEIGTFREGGGGIGYNSSHFE